MGALREVRVHPVTSRQMTSIWPQLEPLLAKVQKPARYIGCEDGAQPPDHDPTRCPGCSIYPDTYEIGLPNQGLQILYEILNERPDAVAERTYAPWTDLEARAARRTACRCSRSTPTARPAPSTCWPSTCRPSSSTRTCSTASTWPACRCGRPSARPEHPLVVRRRPLHLQPRAAGRLPRLRRARRRRGGRVRDHRGRGRLEGARAAPRARATQVLRALARIPGVYVPSMYDVDLRRRRTSWRSTPALPRRARAGREAHDRRPRRLALPEAASSCRSPRSCTTASTSRCSAAAPAAAASARPGMITRPVRERPAEQVRTMIDEGLRRTGYDEVALTSLSTADFSGIETVVRRHRRRPRRAAARCRCRCPACGSTPSPSASPPRSRRPAAPGSRSPPRPARGACAR